MTWFDQYSALHLERLGPPRSYDRARTLYCITEGPGLPIKIGLTRDLYVRYQALQVHTWRPIYVCWTAECAHSVHESAIKHILRGIRLSGEWFLDPDDALKNAENDGALTRWINDLAAKHGASVGRDREPKKPPTIIRWLDGQQAAA